MGLVGSLEDLSLLDILQIVNVSRRTGVLRLQPDHAEASFIHFRTGSVEDIVGDFDETPFYTFFLREGLIEPSEYTDALARSGGDPRRAIAYLVDCEILNLRLVEQARRGEISARIRHLVSHAKTGQFAFFLTDQGEEGESESPGTVMPLREPVSPQHLLSQAVAEQAVREATPLRPVSPSQEPSTPPAQPKKAAAPSEAPFPTPPASRQARPEHAESTEDLLPEADAVPVGHGEHIGLPVVHPQAAVPAAAVPERRAPPSPQQQRASFHEASGGAKNQLTILLAADESIFKNLLWQRLLKHFSRVERVSSLSEYLSLSKSLLEHRTPFLSVVDLLMPTQDGKGYLGGMEILEQSQSRFPEVKVLLTTDLQDPRMDDLAKARGASAILKKPEFAHLQVGQLESAIDTFGDTICAEVAHLAPPVEEEVASFLRDLGAEQVSDGFRVRDQLGLLKGLMGELANPQESSEISLLVLRLAAEYFERAILFLVKRDEVNGLGGFGDTGDHENMIQKVRRLRIPVGVGSSLDEVLSSRVALERSAGQANEVDNDFHDALGTLKPECFVFVPMVSRGRVIAVLYADNAVTNCKMPDISGMEIFMAQAGLAMEKALLERQLMTMKKGLKTGQ